MKQEVKQDQADFTIEILVRDTSGNAKTGLTNASAGIDVSYSRVETDNDVTQTDGAIVALASPALTDPHLDWGFLEIDATNHPGLYRLDIADGAFAVGAWSSVVTLIADGCEPSHCEFVLLPELPYVGVTMVDWLNGGRLDLLLDAIKVVTDALTAASATKLALSAGTIVPGTVSHDATAASTTVFYSDDITEATADHFNGRIVIFTSGALQNQATDITDYELAAGEGKFTVTTLTEAPADNVTFVIV